MKLLASQRLWYWTKESNNLEIMLTVALELQKILGILLKWNLSEYVSLRQTNKYVGSDHIYGYKRTHSRFMTGTENF